LPQTEYAPEAARPLPGFCLNKTKDFSAKALHGFKPEQIVHFTGSMLE
jgi:hypothetical protein